MQAEKSIGLANANRVQITILASELRHSSDDLTRMSRSYVATADPFYKQRFYEILDIRDGRKPRPVEYEKIYWDLVSTDDKRPRPMGPTAPLLELFRKAGVTDAELLKLSEAKRNSDALVQIEFAAMSLIEPPNLPDAALKQLRQPTCAHAPALLVRPQIGGARAFAALTRINAQLSTLCICCSHSNSHGQCPHGLTRAVTELLREGGRRLGTAAEVERQHTAPKRG